MIDSPDITNKDIIEFRFRSQVLSIFDILHICAEGDIL